MNCPNCKRKHSAIIVYGHCVDENENEYPFDARIYESGSSLPAWGEDRNGVDYWPTRFCYKCRSKFNYVPEEEAMHFSYEDALKKSYEENPICVNLEWCPL